MFKIIEFFNCIKHNDLIRAYELLDKNIYFINVEYNGYYPVEYAIIMNNNKLFNKLVNIEINYSNIINILISYPTSDSKFIEYFKIIFNKYKTKIEENEDINKILNIICNSNSICHMEFMFELGYNPKNINLFENKNIYDSIKCYKLINIIDIIEFYFPYEIHTIFDKILYLIRKKNFNKAKKLIDKNKELTRVCKINRGRNIDSFILGNAVLYDTELKLIPFLLKFKYSANMINDAIMMTRDYKIYKYITDIYDITYVENFDMQLIS